MKIHKLSSTDAFIAFEFEEGAATGVTRLAPKVLQDGAKLLARSTTYAFATFGVEMGGGSAGVNAAPDDRDDVMAAFVAEVADLVEGGRWTTDPSLGTTEADFAPLRTADPRPDDLMNGGAATMTGQGTVAAAAAVRDGGLSGARVAFVGGGPIVDAAKDAASEAGAEVVDGGIDADADVVFLAGKAGMLDHDLAATVTAGMVVPLTAVPLTARAHAVLSQAGIVHVPDFVSTAAPLLHAHHPDIDDGVAAVAEAAAQLGASGTGMWMAAIERAETFLATWQDELPYGRPLA